MSKKFHDPIAYSKRKMEVPFNAPTKEEATTGRFMSAGDDYGVGHRTPVGTEKVSNKSPIPQKSFCAEPDGFVR